MEYLRQLWNFDKTKSPTLFYDKYEILNNFFNIREAYDLNLLKKIQIDTLRESYKNKNSVKQLNDFLIKLQGENVIGTEEDLFAKLVNGINKGLNGFDNKQLIWGEDQQKEYKEKLEEILNKIKNLINNKQSSYSYPSLVPLITTIQNGNYDKFIQEKGQYLEDVGAWIMKEAGLTGFTTGAWKTQDLFFGEDFDASIIEDVMGLLSSGGAINGGKNNSVTLKIEGYNKSSSAGKNKKNIALQKWIDQIEKLNGKNLKVGNGQVIIGTNINTVEDFIELISLINDQKAPCSVKFSIVLSSNLHQVIKEISANIQAKTSVERHLANNGARSLYSIKNDDYYNKLQSFSNTKPVIQGTAVTEEEQNTKYKIFTAYVNWHLSKNINNTVYGQNEFYLTKEGFVDLATLMERRGFLIRIKASALSYKEFLTNKFGTTYK